MNRIVFLGRPPFLLLPLMAATHMAMAQQEASPSQQELIEEVVIVGSRNTEARSVADSPVPVDVFNTEEFSSVGAGADITDNLNALVPSYIATPATGDGSAFVRPTSLRGLASDQTLVLVNGKRRHRSALVQLFAPAANNGSHGVDVAFIPAVGLKQVEVLRDGAAAQYGSDAIAGVVNFNLKDSAEGGEVSATYGQHFEGEESWMVAGNVGLPVTDDGFVNLTLNSNDNDALSRGRQLPNAQALIDAGVSGVGADAVFGDAPLAQTWGRPQTRGTRFVWNSGLQTEHFGLYSFGNYGQTKGRYRFFWRSPNPPEGSGLDGFSINSDLEEALALGATNLGRESVAGYTPYLDGEQEDWSGVIGIKSHPDAELSWDVSATYGSNELDYTLFNSLNGDAPLVNGEAVRNFDTGDYEQEETNINADFGYSVGSQLFLAWGLEYREETFTQKVGDRNAYIGGGSSGLAGTRPEDAGEYSRDNVAVYTDAELSITDDWLVQAALRYEDFSDFGDTLNWKLASRLTLTDNLALRGALSTGFHAPTPGQSNLRTTTTTLSNDNVPIETGLFPADSAVVANIGGTPLKEEEAFNVSFGLTSEWFDALSVTLDGYWIKVEDRIYRTAIDNISFYTNALDVIHQGVDLVLQTDYAGLLGSDNQLTLAYAYNQVEVDDNRLINGNQVVSDDLVEDIENNYPNHKLTLTNQAQFGDQWQWMARIRMVGDHFDERGNIAGTSELGRSQEVDAVFYVDTEVTYLATEALSFTLGASNLFDEFPNTIEDQPGVANRIGVGLPYPRRSPANYEGGAWYLRARYQF